MMIGRIASKVVPKIPIGKVDIFIVGAQKGGTTALYKYLTEHPQVRGTSSEFKETGFFTHDNLYRQGYNYYHKSFFQLESLHDKFFNSFLYLESAPGYLCSEDAPRRIAAYNPNAKLIFTLREPVSRAVSQWNMFIHLRNSPDKVKKQLYQHHIKPARDQVKQGWQEFMYGANAPDMEAYIKQEILGIQEGKPQFPYIVSNGLYAKYLPNYIKYFDREQLFITEHSRLRYNTERELRDIQQFLGIDKHLWNDMTPVHNREYIVVINDDIKELLRNFYEEPNQKLFSLLKTEFPW